MISEPGVEMLWETADPQVVLNNRFGFSSGSETAVWLRKVLSLYYDMTLEDCQHIVMSDSNALAWVSTDQGRFIVKWSVAPEKFTRLTALSDLTVWLGNRGHPVSTPVLSRTGETQILVDSACLNVQHVMTGHHLDITDTAQVHEAGATLARLHADLADYPKSSSMPGVERPTHSTHAFISSWLESDLSNLSHASIVALQTCLAAASTTPMETQLVHGDFRAANILTRDTQVTAVLDFEEMRYDSAVGELARSAVMLGTLFHNWGPVSPQVHQALLKGYESVCPLNEQEKSWWQPLLLWWSLLMVPTTGDDLTGWGEAAERLTRTLNSMEER